MSNPFRGTQQTIPGAAAHALPEQRMVFIRKVYAAFMASILVAAAGAVATLRVPGVGEFVANNYFLVIFGEFAALAGVIFLRRKKGVNVAAFAAFAALTGLTTGLIVSSYLQAGLYDVVVQAAGLTVVAFGSLTGYAFLTKKDFSFMRGFVTIGLFVVLGGAVLTWFVQSSALNFAVSAGGVLLFSGFILYDTSNIIHHYREDEWVGAAMGLYLNVLNLFLFLLRLLSSRD